MFLSSIYIYIYIYIYKYIHIHVISSLKANVKTENNVKFDYKI